MAQKEQKIRADSPRGDTTDRALTDSDMKLQKVLVFVLSIAACVASNLHDCIKEDDLENVARRKLHLHHYQHTLPTQASTVPLRCDPELYSRDRSMEGRSISPWAYVKRDLPEHFPSTYYEAQCLCQGCIVLNEDGEPEENHNYNSRAVNQSRMFLKKELCEDTGEGRRYHLKPVSIDVNVACVCVRPSFEQITK